MYLVNNLLIYFTFFTNYTILQLQLKTTIIICSDYIVDKAFEFNIGARGLRTLCEAILNDAMFNLPSSDEKELKITKIYADQRLQKIDISHLKAVS